MPVSPAAIERYLEQPVPYLPQFKHADPEVLKRSIYNSTGQPLYMQTELRPHQLEGLALALYLRRALLFFVMQLGGKTLIALNWAMQLRRSRLWTGRGIIIAHSPLGLDVWCEEAKRHTDLRVVPIHLDFDQLVDTIAADNFDLIVIPWSGLQEMFTVKGISKKGTKKLYPNYHVIEALAACFDLAIIDEIHYAKNHSSLRFLIGAALLKQCKFRLGLTGTPFGRDPFDLWAEAFLIDEGKALGYNYYFFEQAFGIKSKNYVTGFTQWTFDKAKMPILEYKLSSLMMSYKRDEFPNQTVYNGVVALHMSGDQLEAYGDVISRLIQIDEKNKVEIQNTFVRLRQVSSGYLPFDDTEDVRRVVRFRSNPKLEWLREFAEAAPADVQVIVFTEFTQSGAMICEVLSKLKIPHGWLYGGSTDSEGIVRDFKERKTRILVSNAVKGGTSIQLPIADYIIFFESPVSPITRQQAEARPMARGARPLMIDDLVVSGVERRILEYIAEGRSLMQSLAKERQSFGAGTAAPPPVRRRAPRRETH